MAAAVAGVDCCMVGGIAEAPFVTEVTEVDAVVVFVRFAESTTVLELPIDSASTSLGIEPPSLSRSATIRVTVFSSK